jgi:hypothetical protein
MGARNCSQSFARADKVKAGVGDWASDSFALSPSTDTMSVSSLSPDLKPKAKVAAFAEDLKFSSLPMATSSASKCGSRDSGNISVTYKGPVESLEQSPKSVTDVPASLSIAEVKLGLRYCRNRKGLKVELQILEQLVSV